MTNKRVQFRRGTATEHNSFTGAAGEVTVNTTNASLRIHDGSTAGGTEMARADLTNISSSGGSINVQGRKITGLATPTESTDAATKAYADSLAAGGNLDNLTDVTMGSLASAQLLVYNGTGAWENVALSGHATINASGALSISDGVVSSTLLAADAVITDKIENGAVTNVKLEHSSVSINAYTLSLGSTLTIEGTSDEVSVSMDGGTISVGLPSDVTVSGTLTVGGNLVVSGTTTTVNTEEVLIEDNILTLNSSQTGTPSNTLKSGFEIERGDEANAALVWDEGTDKWQVSSDSSAYNDIIHTGMLSVVSSALLATDAVITDKIENGAVTTAKIADSAVSSTLLATDAVITGKIKDGAVTTAKIADSAVSSTLIASNAIIAAKIANGEIAPIKTTFIESEGFTATSGNIFVANGNKFKSVSVGGALIANSLGEFSIANQAIGTLQLDESAVITAKIAPNAVTNDKLANSTLELAAAATSGTFALGGRVAFTGTSDLAVSLSGGTFSFSLAATLSNSKVSSLSNLDTGDLSEGSNLYFTSGRVKEVITGSTAGSIDAHIKGLLSGTADQVTLSGGTISLAADISGVDTITANTFIGALNGTATQASTLSNFSTDSLSEGLTNLYFTDARAQSAFSSGANISISGGTIAFSGPAPTAEALASAVTISLSGAVSGSASFDGSGNVVIANTISDASISNAKLANSGVSLNSGANASTLSLGGSVYIEGTSAEIEVALSGSTFTIGLPNSVTITNVLAANTLSGNVSASSLRISDTLITASAEEINRLYDASSGNNTTGKVAVLGTNGNLTLGGGLVANGSVDVTGAYFAVNNSSGPVFQVNTNTDSVVVNTAALSVEDSLVLLNNNNMANADVGIYGNITASTYAAVAYDRSASKWKVGTTSQPTAGNVFPFPATLGSLSGFAAGSVETAALTVGTLEYPSAAGTNGQVLLMSGSTLSFGSVPAQSNGFTLTSVSATLSAGTPSQVVIFNATVPDSYEITLPTAASAGAGHVVTVAHHGDSSAGLNVLTNNPNNEEIRKKTDQQAPVDSITVFNAGVLRLVSDGSATWYEV